MHRDKRCTLALLREIVFLCLFLFGKVMICGIIKGQRISADFCFKPLVKSAVWGKKLVNSWCLFGVY